MQFTSGENMIIIGSVCFLCLLVILGARKFWALVRRGITSETRSRLRHIQKEISSAEVSSKEQFKVYRKLEEWYSRLEKDNSASQSYIKELTERVSKLENNARLLEVINDDRKVLHEILYLLKDFKKIRRPETTSPESGAELTEDAVLPLATGLEIPKRTGEYVRPQEFEGPSTKVKENLDILKNTLSQKGRIELFEGFIGRDDTRGLSKSEIINEIFNVLTSSEQVSLKRALIHLCKELHNYEIDYPAPGDDPDLRYRNIELQRLKGSRIDHNIRSKAEAFMEDRNILEDSGKVLCVVRPAIKEPRASWKKGEVIVA